MFAQLLLACVVLLLTRVVWRRWKYDLHKIPAPPGLPLLGQTLSILSGKGLNETTRVRSRWFKSLGDPKIMKLDVLGRTLLLIRDLDCSSNVIMSKKDPLPRGTLGVCGLITMIGNDPTAKSILTTGRMTPYVRAVRRSYATAFQTENLKLAFPRVQGVLKTVKSQIDAKKGQSIDFQQLCVQTALDVVGVVGLDSNLGGLDGSRDIQRLLIEAGYVGRERGFNPFKNLYCALFPNSVAAQKQITTVQNMTDAWNQLTQEILDKKAPEGKEEPLWYALRSLKDPETDKPLEFNRLRAEIASMILGGMDSTGHQMAWLLAVLASHPAVTDKLLAELKEHELYGEGAREVTFEDLSDLTYLTAIIKEGMRIVTVITGSFMRELPADRTLMGYRVPKGTIVTLPGNRSIDTEAEWGDPQVFRPERWLTGEDMSTKYYFGFSMGPRECPGQKLAMMEMRLAIIELLKAYKLALTVSFDELMQNCRNGLAIEAMDGMWMTVEERVT